jgi:hypothetical protein
MVVVSLPGSVVVEAVRASRARAFLDPPQDWGGYMQLDDGFRLPPTSPPHLLSPQGLLWIGALWTLIEISDSMPIYIFRGSHEAGWRMSQHHLTVSPSLFWSSPHGVIDFGPDRRLSRSWDKETNTVTHIDHKPIDLEAQYHVAVRAQMIIIWIDRGSLSYHSIGRSVVAQEGLTIMLLYEPKWSWCGLIGAHYHVAQ